MNYIHGVVILIIVLEGKPDFYFLLLSFHCNSACLLSNSSLGIYFINYLIVSRLSHHTHPTLLFLKKLFWFQNLLSFLQENIRAGRHVLCCTGTLRWLRCDREQNRSRLSQESFMWSRLHCGLHVRVHRS